MSCSHLSKQFFELDKAFGESKSKQEEDRIITAEVSIIKGKFGKKANNLIEEHNIKTAYVKYVDLRDLNNELLKYKYGFLLRRDNLVNNVATPTKMNSYLACGLIPIFTDAITDYKDQINLKFRLIKQMV